MKIINALREIFEQKGIFVSEEDFNESLSIDSLQFVSIIVEIENYFNITIDDCYMTQVELRSFNDFVKLIESISNSYN